MRIILEFSYVENCDGTCAPLRLYNTETSCRNGLEAYTSAIQRACIDAANKVLEEMSRGGVS